MTPPDLFRTNNGFDVLLFDMAIGLGVRNVIGVGDPDVQMRVLRHRVA